MGGGRGRRAGFRIGPARAKKTGSARTPNAEAVASAGPDGVVFQFYNLIPTLTALENVAVVTDILSKDPGRERLGDGYRLEARFIRGKGGTSSRPPRAPRSGTGTGGRFS